LKTDHALPEGTVDDAPGNGVVNLQQRREQILAYLEQETFVRTAQLSRLLGISEVSIRKDLDFLAQRGLVKRLHGGAQLVTEALPLLNLSSRYLQHKTAKEQIAAAAVTLVDRPGQTIYIDTGTTNLLFARLLPRELPITVVTNSLSTIAELEGRPACRVIALGGVVDYQHKVLTGLWTDQLLERFNFDMVFTGADSVTPEGFGGDDLALSEILRKAISRTKASYVLADSSKITRRSPNLFAGVGEMTAWITDSDLPPAFCAAFTTAGGHVRIAGAPVLK